MEKKRCTAIVLAAGRGSRMNSDIAKQYLLLKGKPILYYALKVFEDSPIIDDIILVTGKEEIEYCKTTIVEKYKFQKVRQIIAGGAERYLSVNEALLVIKQNESNISNSEGYIFIHDGARPFVNEAMIQRAYEGAQNHGACVLGMPVKDTIKIADEEGFAIHTPERSKVWMIQTPQVFESKLVIDAYEALIAAKLANVTDDAMVIESMTEVKVKLIEGGYENIKITTPEDLEIAEVFLDTI